MQAAEFSTADDSNEIADSEDGRYSRNEVADTADVDRSANQSSNDLNSTDEQGDEPSDTDDSNTIIDKNGNHGNAANLSSSDIGTIVWSRIVNELFSSR